MTAVAYDDVKLLNMTSTTVTDYTRQVIEAGVRSVREYLAAGEKLTEHPLEDCVLIIVGGIARAVSSDSKETRAGIDIRHKQDLRQFFVDSGQPTLVPESTLARCESFTPPGLLRVLCITEDNTVACLVPISKVGEKTTKDLEIGKAIFDILKPLKGDVKKKTMALLELTISDAFRELEKTSPHLLQETATLIARVEALHVPPKADTAGNTETLAMAAAYALDGFTPFWAVDHDFANARGNALAEYFWQLREVYPRVVAFFDTSLAVFNGHAYEFGRRWLKSNFARLEVGHKLAASLCLTDVPDDIEVSAPWEAWSLIVPDGILGDIEKEGGRKVNIARLWCLGTDMQFILLADGELLGPFFPDSEPPHKSTKMLRAAIRGLVRGACLAIADPDEYKRERMGKPATGVKGSKRSGPPELEQARYMLSAPVTLDLREPLLDMLSGKTHKAGGGPLSVQFLVRGHWRQQVHGVGRLLRKKLWIKPFWKGDENARILLRNYKVKEDGEAEENSGDKKSGSADTS